MMTVKKNRSLCVMFVLSVILSLFCFANSASAIYATGVSETDMTIRVNGKVVEFTDAKPYIDANGRTMIPMRMVTETLGAKVEWNQKTYTASVSKNGITVYIPIGSDTLTVKENGKTSTVKMDTKAEITNNRTCVPIRFVAEALGAYVDWSNEFRTVGIYQDVLSAEQIEKLRSYPYTTASSGVSATVESYESFLERTKPELMAAYFGEDHLLYPTFGSSYETAHEYLYHKYSDRTTAGKDYMPNINKTVCPCNHSEYCDALVDEFVKRIGYESKNVKVVFEADTSCLYQPNANSTYFTIRGYMSVYGMNESLDVTNDERNFLDNIKSEYLSLIKYEYYPVDVHVRRTIDDIVVIWRVVKLDNSMLIKR